MSLSLTPEHGYVLLASAVISLQSTLSAGGVSGLRKKFNVPYPDSGDGRYAAKLSDEQYEQFHNALRAHRNYTEQLGVVQSLLFASSILHPKLSAGLGTLYIIGRQAYYYGYINKGPSGRYAGAAILNFGLAGLFFSTIYSGLKVARLV